MTTIIEPELLLDGSRGIYIPQVFAEHVYSAAFEGIDEEDIEILQQGPDHEWYWEAWDNVLRDGYLIANILGDEVEYTLYQDGDLFLIPDGWDTENWEPESE